MRISPTITHVATMHGHREFRLARSLINNYTYKKGGVFGVPDDIRLMNVGIHLPDEMQTYRRCRYYSTKKTEKRTKIQCSTCGVALCAKVCFKSFHIAPSQ